VTAPLPRGVVRLTTVDDKPLLAPAAAIMATPVNKDWSRYRVGGESIVDAFDAHPDSDGWQVKETVDEIQAALVAALGAQDATARLSNIDDAAAKDAEIALLKTELANMTAAAEVAARAHDALQVKLDEERKALHRMVGTVNTLRAFLQIAVKNDALGSDDVSLVNATLRAHDEDIARRAAEKAKPEGGA